MDQFKFNKISLLFCLLQFFLTLPAYSGNDSNIVSSAIEIANSDWLKPGLLNSTRIELKFGSYGVQILAQDPIEGIRLSSLYSVHEGDKIARTIAFTQYQQKINEKLIQAHHEILEGSSIGSTLKKYGFDIKKDLLFKGLVESLPQQLQNLMHTQLESFAAVIYNLYAKDVNQLYLYCTIVEIYSPEFLTLDELHQIYPEPILPTDNIPTFNIFFMMDQMGLISSSVK